MFFSINFLVDDLFQNLSDRVCTPEENTLTHSCLENLLTSIVWTYTIFVNNFAIKYKLEKCLKESC